MSMLKFAAINPAKLMRGLEGITGAGAGAIVGTWSGDEEHRARNALLGAVAGGVAGPVIGRKLGRFRDKRIASTLAKGMRNEKRMATAEQMLELDRISGIIPRFKRAVGMKVPTAEGIKAKYSRQFRDKANVLNVEAIRKGYGQPRYFGALLGQAARNAKGGV